MPNPYAKAASAARGMFDKAGDAVRRILAYHGSPHDFDRFDASKVGTGEGGQAFGRGHYFGSTPETAEYYRSLTTGNSQETPEAFAGRIWRMAASDPGSNSLSPDEVRAKAMDIVRQGMSQPGNLDPAIQDLHLSALSHLSRQKGTAPAPVRQGFVYEVEIAHPESALLNLDRHATGAHRQALARAVEEAPANKWRDYAADELKARASSQTILESLLRAHNVASGHSLGRRASQEAVASSLLRAGVPGLRYMGDQSQNYVMLPGTEDSITILRKYGLLPVVGAGAAAAGQYGGLRDGDVKNPARNLGVAGQ